MSWGVSASQKDAEELFTALDETFQANYADPHEAITAQFEAAKECVDSLLNVVEGEVFNCSLMGHSQEAMPGSAPDSLSISLSATTALSS